MKREQREIGIGVAAAAVFLCVLFFMQARNELGSIPAGKGIFLSAKFNKVDGVTVGSDVRLGGIRIGSVAQLVLDNEFRAVMTFAISNLAPLPIDSSASIHTDGLLSIK